MYAKHKMDIAAWKSEWSIPEGSQLTKIARYSMAPAALGVLVLYFLLLIDAVAGQAGGDVSTLF